MRTALVISALVATGLLSGAARAASPAELTSDVYVAVVEKTMPLSVPIVSDLRLRADVETSSIHSDPFGNPEGPMRHRFASSMIDYYPLGGEHGFRVSGGLRLYENAYFFRDAEQKAGGLLWAPSYRGGGNALRGGYSRYTPAATVGYPGKIKGAVVGVEVGSLIGSATSMPSRESGLSNAPRSGLNPIANLMVGFRL